MTPLQQAARFIGPALGRRGELRRGVVDQHTHRPAV